MGVKSVRGSPTVSSNTVVENSMFACSERSGYFCASTRVATCSTARASVSRGLDTPCFSSRSSAEGE
jgi:hypothetical protein